MNPEMRGSYRLGVRSMVTLHAGCVAEQLSQRSSLAPESQAVTLEERTAFHESGHGVARWIFKMPIGEMRIFPGGGGYCADEAMPIENYTLDATDQEKIPRISEVIGREFDAVLYLATEKLLLRHWAKVHRLAYELLEHGVLNEAQIAEVLSC